METAERITVRVKLISFRKGDYKVYVFLDLDTGKYYMITELPNWQLPDLNIGDEGFITYIIVIGGVTRWYDFRQTGELLKHKYSGLYFVDFIHLSNEINYSQDKDLIIEL